MTAGFVWHVRFVSRSTNEIAERIVGVLTNPLDLLNGLPFAFTILAILLAHEMGHYLACRYYGIRATLPYVIPGPPPFNPFGTFGAIIKIKSAFADRRQLFDVGIAGPLAPGSRRKHSGLELAVKSDHGIIVRIEAILAY